MTEFPRKRGRPRMVSVVLPARNEEEHVGEQLAALADQTYTGDWEVVFVDDGSTDGTLEVVDGWADSLPGLRVIALGERKGINGARNFGVRAAKGDFLAFCDGDDVVDPGWLEGLVAAAGDSELVGGLTDHDLLNTPLQLTWCPWGGKRSVISPYDFLPYASGGNLGVWSAIAREFPWDEDFRYGAADVEFEWRVQLAGGRIVEAPDAVMHRRLRPTLRSTIGQAYSYGKGNALLYRKFRRDGMPRNLRNTLWAWRRLLRGVPSIFRSNGERGLWLRRLAVRVGHMVGSVRSRVLYP